MSASQKGGTPFYLCNDVNWQKGRIAQVREEIQRQQKLGRRQIDTSAEDKKAGHTLVTRLGFIDPSAKPS